MTDNQKEVVVTEEMESALIKAKVKLMNTKNSTFFTTVLFSLKFKWSYLNTTAWTDGYTLGFNPEFFMKLSADERVGVLVHEAMHVAYLHNAREGNRKHDEFGQAADHVINLQLIDAGFKMPSWVLKNPIFKGMSTEQVYDQLIAEPQLQQPNEMDDIVQGGDDPKKQSDLNEHVKQILVRAAIQSKSAGDTPGSIPGDIELFLERLLNPKLPWTAILRKYVNGFSKSDYSWKKPNRRFFPDHHLPSLHSENLVKLVAYVDISGSVTDTQFKRFVSELAGVFRMVKVKEIVVVQFDTAIHHIDTVKSLNELTKIKFTGRGGTWIEPVFEMLDNDPKTLSLIFTDGGFSMTRQQHKANIVWLINDEPSWTAPFGRVIHYDTNGDK